MIGAITILGMITHQTYWIVNTWNLNEEEFQNKVNLALYRVAQGLARANNASLPPRNIIQQKTSNYYIVNMEDEINGNLLEEYLKREFESMALNIDFEYGVFDCMSKEMVYGAYCKYSPETDHIEESSELTTYDGLNYYFGVKFPNRPSYILGKMWLSIFYSLILLITIAFFLYAMYTMLRQKRLSDMQKDFINNMTHEFKTPISTIKISSEVFLNHPLIKEDQRLSNYAKIIKEQNDRLNKQVEKILQLVKIEKDVFELEKEVIDLAPLIEQIIEGCRARVSQQNGTIDFLMEGTSFKVKADRLHLSNVLYNLVDNAIKYCKTSPKIKIKLGQVHDKITLTIEDNGIGIEPDFQTRVFEKFYRVPTGNIHDVKGFGLGLYYVKKIIDLHQWKVFLKSALGKGTTILLEINPSLTK